ncbi:uncharacterized protein LOC130897628 isoform X5 [Diorhabda carinulata]|uniref:uncharacterized protein LOC130897628 isoform X5 n=1 Tax=Diorhabda carinulata TaxID=1163345 RepID=UPI0025A2D005|nr:uncharacterized protein LOC130897628 isoform X5 [Diorhabda carinulata]
MCNNLATRTRSRIVLNGIWTYRVCPESNRTDFLPPRLYFRACAHRLDAVEGVPSQQTSGWSVVSEHLESQDRHFRATCFCELCKPKMQRSLEQRYAIKFCVKLGKSATETFDMIKQAYPDVALARSGVFRWHQAFLEGREEVADEDRAGRPSTSTNTDNVTRVRKVLNTDRRLSIRLIAQMLNLPKSVVHDIVTEHHDNAPAHTAFLVNSYLTKAGIPTLPQPPYSPDVAPRTFFCFLA